MDRPRYRKVLLKLSGEALGGGGGVGIDFAAVEAAVEALRPVWERGVRLGVVVGAGNLFRGAPGRRSGGGGVRRTVADGMGMLATVMNAMALAEVMGSVGVPARVMVPFDLPQWTERFHAGRAAELMETGTVVVFGGGTGNPYFTTDTAAALRAVETGCDLLLKATKVDGVYDRDPERFPDARRFERLTYAEVLERRLGVMDLTAVSLCMENRLPIGVFDFGEAGALEEVCFGEAKRATIIGGEA